VKPITLTLHPSRTLFALLVCAVFFFGLMVFLVPLSQVMRVVILTIALTATLHFCLLNALLLRTQSIVALKINSKNELQLVCKNGEQLEVIVQKNTVVTPYLTVLNCQLQEPTFLQRLLPKHIVILPDAMNVEDYRQLRVWLRWARPTKVQAV
jgi:toxin CptA